MLGQRKRKGTRGGKTDLYEYPSSCLGLQTANGDINVCRAHPYSELLGVSLTLGVRRKALPCGPAKLKHGGLHSKGRWPSHHPYSDQCLSATLEMADLLSHSYVWGTEQSVLFHVLLHPQDNVRLRNNRFEVVGEAKRKRK